MLILFVSPPGAETRNVTSPVKDLKAGNSLNKGKSPMDYSNNTAMPSMLQGAVTQPNRSVGVKDQPLSNEIGERLSHSIEITHRVLKLLGDMKSRLYGMGSKADQTGQARPQEPGFVGVYRDGQNTLTNNLLAIEQLALELNSRT
jgi:hypothetical protein